MSSPTTRVFSSTTTFASTASTSDTLSRSNQTRFVLRSRLPRGTIHSDQPRRGGGSAQQPAHAPGGHRVDRQIRKLFHQGRCANQTFNERWSSQNRRRHSTLPPPESDSTCFDAGRACPAGPTGTRTRALGPLSGTGNATTTPGGAIYTAPGFQIARFTYRLNYGLETRRSRLPAAIQSATRATSQPV